jgi:hypothetical protein
MIRLITNKEYISYVEGDATIQYHWIHLHDWSVNHLSNQEEMKLHIYLPFLLIYCDDNFMLQC